jgi:hypothetical protein
MVPFDGPAISEIYLVTIQIIIKIQYEMKPLRNSILLFLLSVFIFYGCQKGTTQLSDAEIEEIKKEVRTEFDKIIDAADRHDAEEAMLHHWNNQDYLYAANGTINKGWEPMNKIVTSIHSNPKYQSYNVVCDEVILRVISQNSVMVTSSGYFNNFPGEEGPKSVKFALTYLFEKINGKWLVTVGHESTVDKVL